MRVHSFSIQVSHPKRFILLVESYSITLMKESADQENAEEGNTDEKNDVAERSRIVKCAQNDDESSEVKGAE